MIFFSHREEMYGIVAHTNMTSTLTVLSASGETKKEADNYNTA